MPQSTLRPAIGPFDAISREACVDHGVNGRYRIVLYGAYTAHGRIDHGLNGVGVLIEPKDGARGAVVVDGLGQEPASHAEPSLAQIELFETVRNECWSDFRKRVNRSDRTRFKL